MQNRVRARRSFWWLLLVSLGAIVFVIPSLLAGSMLFPTQYCSRLEVPGMMKVKMKDGTELRALFLPNAAAHFTLWYFHGNAEDLGDIEPRLRQLQAAGFAVFAFDYPGYGLSEGKPSEASVFAATERMDEYLRDVLKVPAGRLIIYGRSLGGGAAVELASHRPAAGLVLESAFTSAFRVITHWRLLPFDKFENLRKLPLVSCPVLVIHGRGDGVVPFDHGEALFAKARDPKRQLWVDRAGHNNLLEVAGESYWIALREFEQLCQGTK